MSVARVLRPPMVVLPSSSLAPSHKLKIGAKPVGTAHVQMREGKLRGNTLELSFSHAGGAKKHAYQLAWSGSFLETFPVQTGLTLSHNSKGDHARGLMRPTISVDMTPMRDAYRQMYQTQHGAIRFTVPGLDKSFSYKF